MTMSENLASENEYHIDLMSTFNKFFADATRISTYKPIFIHSLVDVGQYDDPALVGRQWIHHEDSTVRLDLDFIAIRFARYYWNTDVAFDLRHIPERMADENDPNKDVNILSLVREKAADVKKKEMMRVIAEMDSYKINRPKDAGFEIQNSLRSLNPPTLADLASEEMEEFRMEVIRRAIRPEVLPKLEKDMPNLYERVTGQNYILLNPYVLTFMKRFSPLLRKALSCVTALHLEKNNPGKRHIATKADMEKEFDQIQEQIKRLDLRIRRPKPGQHNRDPAEILEKTPVER